MENIVDSFNLFVDSSRSSQAGSKGDNFKLSLANDIIEAGKGQMIRMTLTDFSMEKSFTDINETNKSGNIIYYDEHDEIQTIPFELEEENIDSLSDLASNFGLAIKNTWTKFFVGDADAQIRDDVKQAVLANNVIEVELHFFERTLGKSTKPLTDLQINLSGSDLHLLVGGKYESNVTTASMQTVAVKKDDGTDDPYRIKIIGYFPAQLKSIHHIYLRTDLSNTGIESAGFASDNRHPTVDTEHSTILARIPMQTQVIFFESQTEREYFLNLRQKNVSSLRLYLTDERNRQLPQYTDQSTKGNLRFTCTIRVDVVQKTMPNQLETVPYEPNIPARFTSNLLEKFDFGAPQKTFQ